MRTSPLYSRPHSAMTPGSTWLGPWQFPDGQDADLWVWSSSHLMVVWAPRCYVGLTSSSVPWGALGPARPLHHTEGHEGDAYSTPRMDQADLGLWVAARRVHARRVPVWRPGGIVVPP